MPFNRPKLKTIDERLFNDICSRLKTSAAILSRSVEKILARAIAGSIHLLYGYLEWLAKQRFVHSMEGEFLDQEGATYNLPRRAASTASGYVLLTGNIGSVLPVDSYLKDQLDNTYAVCEEVVFSNTEMMVKVKSLDAGSKFNKVKGEVLSLTNPVSGINNKAIVEDQGIVSGVDVESDDNYRERILDRKRQPPHGGNSNDYKQWALQVQGVTRAWVFPQHMGVGTVGLMFTRDNDVDFIPTEEQCQEVCNYIEKLRPVTAEVFVFPPKIIQVDFIVSLSPDNEINRKSVIEELKDFLYRDGIPGEVLRYSRISEAISISEGEHHHKLILPIHDLFINKNEIPVLGKVEFVKADYNGF